MMKRHGSAVAVATSVMVTSIVLGASTVEQPIGAWNYTNFGSGTVQFELDTAAAARGDVRFVMREESAVMSIQPASTLAVETVAGRFSSFNGGVLHTRGAMLVEIQGSSTAVGNFVIRDRGDHTWTIASTLGETGLSHDVFEVPSAVIDFSEREQQLTLLGELAFSPSFAELYDRPDLANVVVGRIIVNAGAESLADVPHPVLRTDGGVASSIGPDVIVGDLPNVQRWGRTNGITAYSVATTSCNIGTERLDWIASTNNHPVIGQNMYRLKDGRFEQIGLSWLKHGFFALSGSLCTPCNDPTNGSQLGVGCSDPYSSGLNGEQSNLGPRYQVNPSTGFFPYPFSAPNAPATIGRRLQVADQYLIPSQNVGALYFVEGHYITPSDSVVGGDGINNAHNNASYRRVTVSETQPLVFNVQTSNQAPTQREKPALVAWRDHDNSVKLENVDVPNDGRFIVGYKVTDLGTGFWNYEYAVQNLNSDRSAGSFRVPVPAGVNVQNIGFHDVADHSGAPYDTTDWTAVLANGYLTWSTTPYVQNPNGNALRWGSLYNFRFDADAPPIEGQIDIGLYKPGTPSMMPTTASVPDLAMLLARSNPPSNAIDARQPSNIDGSGTVGWQFILLEFTGYALNLQPGEFEVTQEGGMGPAPTILALLPVDSNIVNAFLSSPLSPGTWTTITHIASGTSTRIGYLPGDVNGDGTSSPVDILALIDSLNGVGMPREIWSTDIDRSGVTNPADILRLIDLLNGAGAFDVYNGATLP